MFIIVVIGCTLHSERKKRQNARGSNSHGAYLLHPKGACDWGIMLVSIDAQQSDTVVSSRSIRCPVEPRLKVIREEVHSRWNRLELFSILVLLT